MAADLTAALSIPVRSGSDVRCCSPTQTLSILWTGPAGMLKHSSLASPFGLEGSWVCSNSFSQPPSKNILESLGFVDVGTRSCGLRVTSGLGGYEARAAWESNHLWWGGEEGSGIESSVKMPSYRLAFGADESSDFYFCVLNHLV